MAAKLSLFSFEWNGKPDEFKKIVKKMVAKSVTKDDGRTEQRVRQGDCGPAFETQVIDNTAMTIRLRWKKPVGISGAINWWARLLKNDNWSHGNQYRVTAMEVGSPKEAAGDSVGAIEPAEAPQPRLIPAVWPSLSMLQPPAEIPWATFQNVETLGEGSFAKVYKGVSGENVVAVKTYKGGLQNLTNALAEVVMLEKIGPHPNIVCLLDAWQTASDARLVMEWYPNTLRDVLRNRSFTPAETRSMFSGICAGLARVHSCDLIHLDVKPGNIGVGHDFVPRLLDFGNAISSDIRRRPRVKIHSQYGVREVTLNYRPPELFFGDVAYTQAVDAWSAGCVLFELVKRKKLFPACSEVPTVQDIADAFELDVLNELPLWGCWQTRLSVRPRTAPLQDPIFLEYLGHSGVECLRGLLRPRGRALMVDVAREGWHQHCLVVAVPRSRGIWGDYVVLKGELPPEILARWRCSPLFTDADRAREYQLGQPFDAPITARNAKFQLRQDGRKAVINGCTVPSKGGALFTKDASHFLFDDFAAAISEAFKERNRKEFYTLQANIRGGLNRLRRSELGDNGLEFLSTDIMDWLFILAQDHIFDGRPSLKGFSETKHKDGGASVLHGSMTNNAARDLLLFSASDSTKCEATLSSSAGTFYLGNMVAVEHQVSHPDNSVQRPIEVANRAALVSVQLRCKIFSHDQARGKKHKPTPEAVFDVVNEAIVTWLEGAKLSFPTLEACENKLRELKAKAITVKKRKAVADDDASQLNTRTSVVTLGARSFPTRKLTRTASIGEPLCIDG